MIQQRQISDCFQIAIAQVDEILKGFTLKSYANAIFSSAICQTLCQKREAESPKTSAICISAILTIGF
ncbi:hypothetical protein [Nostoc sp. 'Lobaria pulmonaria (5183) cyanobiont']|uniref:hypothetical protein n=1 Tax=Nostoc sp. 'Lobaria pulmonaria (5183) cyanobiont' TaxID=1618022 RepID=UPI000CF34F92|nr:hypothetical protein [Nostoc sp. 'Lobaria pulmonaria (5183) cyanobiont']